MTVSSSASSASTISQIQAQVKNLQKEVTEENASTTDDAKTKAMLVTMYQLEITEDDAEIQQLQQQSASSNATTASSAASVASAAPATGSKLDLKA